MVLPRISAASIVRMEIRLEVGNRAAMLAALEGNTLDLALTRRAPRKMAVQKAWMGEHPHSLIAPPDHRLAGQARAARAEVVGETFLVRDPDSGTRLLMERQFANAHVTLRIGMGMGSKETIKPALMAGLGIGRPVTGTWFIVNLAKIEAHAVCRRPARVHDQPESDVPADLSADDAGLVLPGRSAKRRRRARLRIHSPGPERLL